MNQRCFTAGIGSAVSMMSRLIARLSSGQYRVVLALMIIGGAFSVYRGPAFWLVDRNMISASSRATIVDREAERRTLTSTLEALEAELARYQSVGAEPEDHAQGVVGDSPEELVHLLDRAARQSSVKLGEIQAKGVVAGAGTLSAARRYQLHAAGSYRGIASLMAILSAEQQFVKILEIEVKTDGWAYPSRPLEARVVLQTDESAAPKIGERLPID